MRAVACTEHARAGELTTALDESTRQQLGCELARHVVGAAGDRRRRVVAAIAQPRPMGIVGRRAVHREACHRACHRARTNWHGGRTGSGSNSPALTSPISIPKEIWTWRAAGLTEWTMRAPVALLGALTILVLCFVAHPSLGARPSLWLGLLLALSPWHLWVSQVCRFYMQLFLLYNLALLFYYRATMDGRLVRAGAAMVCMVLAFYTSPIALMIVGVFGVDIAMSCLRRRPTGMRPAFWAMGMAAIAICVVGVLSGFGFAPEESALPVRGYAGFKGTPQSIPVLTMGMIFLIEGPMAVIAALGFWALLHRNERLAILLAAAAIVPVAVLIGFNLLGKDTHVRYTFVALFAWLALAAIGIEAIVAALRPRLGIVVRLVAGGGAARHLRAHRLHLHDRRRRLSRAVAAGGGVYRGASPPGRDGRRRLGGTADDPILSGGARHRAAAAPLFRGRHARAPAAPGLDPAAGLSPFRRRPHRKAEGGGHAAGLFHQPGGATKSYHQRLLLYAARVGVTSAAAVGGAKHASRGPVRRGSASAGIEGASRAYWPKMTAGWRAAGSRVGPFGGGGRRGDRSGGRSGRASGSRTPHGGRSPMTSAHGHALTLYARGPKV